MERLAAGSCDSTTNSSCSDRGILAVSLKRRWLKGVMNQKEIRVTK